MGEQQPNAKSEISEHVIDSIKKRKTIETDQISSMKTTMHDSPSVVSLPHLVYKVDFHENQILQHSVWSGSNADNILKNILHETKKKGGGGPTNQKNDSKVIVVLELPVGGQVSRYSIGDTDDTLEVEILKHSLMLNPKALLFSGIQAGILDELTDGPTTARGGIRLNECAKALRVYHSKSTWKNRNSGENEQQANKMTVSFKLPEFVNRDVFKHYSYCFEKSVDNPLQYSITYFEFDIKDPKEKEDNTFRKAATMYFSDQQHKNSNNGNTSYSTRHNRSSHTPGGQLPGHQRNGNVSYSSAMGNQFAQSSTSASTSNATFAATNVQNPNHDMEDMEHENDKNKVVYTEDDFDKLKEHLLAEMQYREDYWSKHVDSEVQKYKDKMKRNLAEYRSQKQQMKEYCDRKEEVLARQQQLLDEQNLELEKKRREIEANRFAYESEVAILKAQLYESERANQEMKNSLALVNTKAHSPRVINTHPDFESLVDSENKAVPSKRLRAIDEESSASDNKEHDSAATSAISEDASSISMNDSLDEIVITEEEAEK